jgi:hypothetical protein
MNHLWPVIHYQDIRTTLDNAHIASKCGAKGVFLIHMESKDELLPAAAQAIQKELPDLQVGINALSKGPLEALQWSLSLGLHATWCDNCGVSSKRGFTDEGLEVVGLLAKHPSLLWLCGL